MDLVAGQNVPLTDRAVRVRVAAAGDRVVMAAVDADDQLVGPVGDLGYPGVYSFDADGFEVNLSAVDRGTNRCLLAVVIVGTQAPVLDLTGADTALRFSAGPVQPGVSVLGEFYRRQDQWKFRALGQHYPGLAQLAKAHGGAPDPAMPTGATATQGRATSAWEPDLRAVELMKLVGAIWQDAARSEAAYSDAVGFADERRNQEIGALYDDPLGSQNSAAQEQIDAKHAELVTRAAMRRLEDTETLRTELAELERTLPAAVAAWDSPAWRDGLHQTGSLDLVRLGVVQRDPNGVQIPWLQLVPQPQGTLLDCADGEILSPAVIGRLTRMAAAVDQRRGTVVIGNADLRSAMGLPADPASDLPGARIEALNLQLDLLDMATDAGDDPDLGQLPALVVVTEYEPLAQPDPAHRYDVGESGTPNPVERLVLLGASFDVAVVFVMAPHEFSRLSVRLDARLQPTGTAVVTDGWTGLDWEFTPDQGPPPEVASRLQAHLASQRS